MAGGDFTIYFATAFWCGVGRIGGTHTFSIPAQQCDRECTCTRALGKGDFEGVPMIRKPLRCHTSFIYGCVPYIDLSSTPCSSYMI